MQFCRMYSGDDGKSHFEELEQNAGSQHFLNSQPVKALVFKNDMNREDLHGWHNAPRRQWCITLSGSVEIGIGDGTVKNIRTGRCLSRRRRHRPGTYRFAERLGCAHSCTCNHLTSGYALRQRLKIRHRWVIKAAKTSNASCLNRNRFTPLATGSDLAAGKLVIM